MPLQDSLAGIWNRQIGLDYGKSAFNRFARVRDQWWFFRGVNQLSWRPCDYLGYFSFIGCLYFAQLPTPATLPISNRQTAQAESISYRQLLSEARTRRLLIAISLIQGVSRCLLCLQHALLGFARNRSENDQPIVGHFCGSGSDFILLRPNCLNVGTLPHYLH